MEKLRGKVIVKVGIYLRKSRAEDGVQDLKKHKDYLIEICNKNEWLYDLYEEVDSSQDIQRAELQRLRQDIVLGKIDAVMVHAVDRLSRRSRHFLEIIEDYFIAEGMTTLYVKDTPNNLLDSTTITMLQLQATLSQAEYSFIVARLKEGRRQSAKQGIWSGKMVYGYQFDKETRKVITVESELPVVRKICDMVLEGYSYGSICTELDKLEIRTRKGKKFEVHNIKSIVHSPIIRGHVIVNWNDGEETIVKDSHEAVVTEAEYSQMQAILERRSEQYTYKSVAPKHFLQGLLHCASCGLVMVVQANKESTYKEGTRLYGDYRYYVRKCRNKDCTNYGCNVTEIEDILKEVLKQFSVQVKEKIEVLREVNEDEIKKVFSSKVKELEKAITKLENKEESLLDLLLDGTITKDVYNKRIENMKESKAQLITELNALPSINVEQETKHADNIIDLIEHYEGLNGEDKRRLLQLTFAKIDYTRNDKKDTPTLDCYPN
ncbi:MAG: recombinase family protein [Bacillota bacterium]